MKLGLTVWNGRISPVFDTAGHLLLLEVQGGQVVSRDERDIPMDEPAGKVARLTELGVETLVCGAVSLPLANMITARRIRLIPFVAGAADEVVAAFLAGALPSPDMAMPGCCGRRAMHRRGPGGRGWGGGGGGGGGGRRGRGRGRGGGGW